MGTARLINGNLKSLFPQIYSLNELTTFLLYNRSEAQAYYHSYLSNLDNSHSISTTACFSNWSQPIREKASDSSHHFFLLSSSEDASANRNINALRCWPSQQTPLPPPPQQTFHPRDQKILESVKWPIQLSDTSQFGWSLWARWALGRAEDSKVNRTLLFVLQPFYSMYMMVQSKLFCF